MNEWMDGWMDGWVGGVRWMNIQAREISWGKIVCSNCAILRYRISAMSPNQNFIIRSLSCSSCLVEIGSFVRYIY
jgi:hypothetical protein